MFLVVLGLHYLARRLSLPPAAALIVGGCAVAFAPSLHGIAIDPEFVLVMFLPPLLMDGAWFTAIAPLRDLMLVTAFVVILVTVLVQGTSLGWVIQWARPSERGSARSPLDLHAAESRMPRWRLRLSAICPATRSVSRVLCVGT